MGFGLTQYIPLIVYIACIFVIVLTILYRAQIGLYFIIFLIPLENLRDKLVEFPFGKDTMDILIIITFISILLRKNKDNFIIYNKSMVYPIVLLILGSYSALWVGYLKFDLPIPISFENIQLIQWKNFIMLPILYFMMLCIIKDKKQIILVIWIIVVTVLIMDLKFYNDVRWYDFSYYREDLRNKVTATFTYLGPNETAAFFVQMSMFLIGLFSLDRLKFRKLIFLGIILLNFYCILYLFSRGAYLASLMGLLFLGIIQNRKILLLLLVLLVSWHTILPTSVIERIEMTKTNESIDPSVSSRFAMWSKALEVVSSNPLTGIGLGGTHYLNIKGGKGIRKDIHNGYLEILLEQGLLGLCIFIYIIYIAFKSGWTLFKEAKDGQLKGLGLGFVAMIIACLADNLTGDRWSYFSVMGYFWVIFGLVVKAKQVDRIGKAETVLVG